MKFILCLLLAVFASMIVHAGDSGVAKELQGMWLPAKAVLGGKPMDEPTLKSISLKITGDAYEVLVQGQLDQGTISVDPKTHPKGMTITGTNGPNKGRIIPAIYEVKGNTMKICYDLSGAKQPSEFKSTEGTSLYLVTYVRKKE
jgi:uncharacterized protein (TIGR03067 family)